jgi:hypothetical protein
LKTISDTYMKKEQEEGKQIIRKVYWSDMTAFVSLDPSIVQKFGLNHRSYVEQVAGDNEIRLIIHKLV